MMKKHWKIAAVLSVCILALAGCGNGETAETFAETVSDTVAAEVTETAEEQTSEEITSAEETETKETASKETTAAETDEASTAVSEGDYYECVFDDFIVAHSEESFISKGGTQEMLDAAKAAVLETDNFKDAYAEMTANPDDLYDWYFNEGRLLDKDGNFTAVFNKGFSGDFDGDGKNEAFIVYSSVGYTEGGASAAPYRDGEYAVFTGSDGAAEVVSYGIGGSCAAIRYNRFIHMLAKFGVNNNTIKAEIFALEDGKPVKKHEGAVISGVTHGFMIEEIAPQAPAPWYVFWDNNAHEYTYVSNYGLERVRKEGAAYADIDLDTAAGSTVPLKIDALTDEEASEMVLGQYAGNYYKDCNDVEIYEIFKEDLDGDGTDEFIVKTAYSSDNKYITGGENTKNSDIWAVTSRTCKTLGYYYNMPADNSDVFITSVGNNKIICVVESIDTEKTYQLVSCYTMLKGDIHEVSADSGYKIVTDMTSLYLQNNTDENDIQSVQSVEEVFGEQEQYEQALVGSIVLK